jgi:hypothetical protein
MHWSSFQTPRVPRIGRRAIRADIGAGAAKSLSENDYYLSQWREIPGLLEDYAASRVDDAADPATALRISGRLWVLTKSIIPGIFRTKKEDRLCRDHRDSI